LARSDLGDSSIRRCALRLGALARLEPPDLVDHLGRVAAELCDRAAEMVEHVHAVDCVPTIRSPNRDG
jgi:hypothetical protein